MSAWTSAAKDELNRFLAALRRPLEQAGADAAEVLEDIKRHIDMEVAASRMQVVTVTELKPMLARIGEPFQVQYRMDPGACREVAAIKEAEPRREEQGNQTNATPLKPPKTPKGGSVLMLIFGVMLPGATVLFEWLSGFCAQNIFDPLPGWGHFLLAALAPGANFAAWMALRRGREATHPRALTFAMGASLGVSIIYSFIFLPLLPAAAIALIVFGLGLLPLAPMFALAGAIQLRRDLKSRLAAAGVERIRFWPGLLTALGLFALMDASRLATHTGLRLAADPETEGTGVQFLRTFGNEPTMLEACYSDRQSQQLRPLILWIFPQHLRVAPDPARKIYFQVYGRAFNSVPRPGSTKLLAGQSFDPERGGQKVGAPVPDLAMIASRMDATVEPAAALGYMEWIMEFRNDAPSQSEARCEIDLPPGAVVSRLTLWINGEEREAAFAGKSQVRQAYENIVAQRRDPVLVTSSGKDRILLQCFPVPPRGGTMKVRVGITTPLQLTEKHDGIMFLPAVRERNFALGKGLKHSFWIESPASLQPLSAPFDLERTSSGRFMARGTLQDADGSGADSAVLVRRDGVGRESWTRDTRANDDSFILQTLTESQRPPMSQISLVIDGSATMAEVVRRLAAAVPAPGHEVRVFVADEHLTEFTANAATWRDRLEQINFRGGCDNLPALERAWDYASRNGSGAILWLHGPQPELLSSAEGLKQRFQRRPSAVHLFDLPILRAPNQIAAELPASARYEKPGRFGPAEEAVRDLLFELSGKKTIVRAERRREAITTPPEAAEASLHLARLFAFDQVQRLLHSNERDEAVQLAALYQLVTEVSGAVVLETAEQFKAAGLTPVDPKTVPVVPEPGTWALLATGLLLFRFARRRTTRWP